MPNWLAVFALVVWPVVAIALYASRPVVQATIWTILAAQLLLPVGTFFKFAMIPQLDKYSIPSFCALVGCMAVTGRALRIWRTFGPTEILIVMYVAGPVVTSLLNGDNIYVGTSVLPGVGIYDGLSAALSQFITLVPFMLGRQFLRGPNHTQTVLSALTLAGLAYSLPLLFEIRMSPQLHFWFYGYYPSDFIQAVREDGAFRPMVFMGHGLIAGFFAMTAAVASAAMWRTKISVVRFPPGLVTGYLSVVLVLCKSGAALVYGVVLIPLIRWAKPQAQLNVAVVLVTIALSYPLLRIVDVFPTTAIVDTAMAINEPRAYSLKFRFDQEEQLVARVWQRPVFGWGRFGRNRIYVENWQGEAGDASVTDGRWIIAFGQFGIIGFLAEFGLLAMSVFRALGALRFTETFREGVLLAGLALIVAINMVELLPNSSLGPWSWLLAGTLLGCSEAVLARKQNKMLRTTVLASAPHQI
jgi:hypothetical protein